MKREDVPATADPLRIGERAFSSRLLLGTGKYRDLAQTQAAVEPNLLDVLPPERYTLLPNSAGCYSAEDAVRTLRLARELLDGHALTKLEVLGDPQTLYPNMPETLRAAETLVREGFEVMVYCSDDPVQARVLESIGCVAIMPLASLIGSGMGLLNPWNIQLILERAQVPVVVDAGVGTASDAAIAMELGCAAVLMNTAVAQARDPVKMAGAMKLAVQAGRAAHLAGRMPRKLYSATPSSPTAGVIGSGGGGSGGGAPGGSGAT
jgi:thiazole synthase